MIGQSAIACMRRNCGLDRSSLDEPRPQREVASDSSRICLARENGQLLVRRPSPSQRGEALTQWLLLQ